MSNPIPNLSTFNRVFWENQAYRTRNEVSDVPYNPEFHRLLCMLIWFYGNYGESNTGGARLRDALDQTKAALPHADHIEEAFLIVSQGAKRALEKYTDGD